MLEKFKAWVNEVIYKVGMSKAKKKAPILKDVFENPEMLKLEATIEGNEIVVRIKKRES